MNKKAVVIGATGLVGRNLVDLLLENEKFEKVITFSRRPLGISNSKLEENLIDFDHPESWKDLVKGDVLFSALGTTIKQAGNKKTQYKIDYSYQHQFSQIANQNGIPVYVLVSATGASPESKIFYSRMKGELERDVMKIPFQSLNLLRPGLLTGKREKERTGEKIGFYMLKLFNSLGIFKNYRPISGRTVAQAMLNVSVNPNQGINIYQPEQLFPLAGENT